MRKHIFRPLPRRLNSRQEDPRPSFAEGLLDWMSYLLEEPREQGSSHTTQ
jgi:hypothetical protein